MAKKILITRIIPPLAKDMLIGEGFEVTQWEGAGPMSQPELISRCKDVNALLSLGATN